jgi:hypothetical protein
MNFMKNWNKLEIKQNKRRKAKRRKEKKKRSKTIQ